MNLENMKIPYEGLEVCLNLPNYPRGMVIPHPFIEDVVIIKEDNGQECTGMKVGKRTGFDYLILSLWEDRHKHIPVFNGWGALSEEVVKVEVLYEDGWRLHLRNSITVDIDARVFPSGVFPDNVPARTVFRRSQQEGVDIIAPRDIIGFDYDEGDNIWD